MDSSCPPFPHPSIRPSPSLEVEEDTTGYSHTPIAALLPTSTPSTPSPQPHSPCVINPGTLRSPRAGAPDQSTPQALGFIFIARPQLAVNVRDVGPVLEAALDRSAPASIKARCLGSLAELLRAEEDVLVARQAAARQDAAASQQASTLPDAEHRALARRNGEGDNSSVSSGIVQVRAAPRGW
jgi:hypothetical protein